MSGVFLAFADVFHPKHKEWAALADSNALIGALNNLVRAGFVLAYFIVRAVYFPWVVFGYTIPDLMTFLALPASDPMRGGYSDSALITPVAVAIAFTILQWYWAYLLVKQIQKMLAPPKDKTK